MANIIEQVNVGGTVYNIASTAYAVCSTNASEPTKVIRIDGISLTDGLTIHVKFTNANTASNPTLTVAGGDSAANSPIPIVLYGTSRAGSDAETDGWQAGAVVSLTYDGTNWVRDQGYNTNSQESYGNISTSGTLGTASVAVVTDANKLITTENLSVSDPSSGGNSTAFTFIDTISQNGKGKITPTKKAIPTVSSTTAGLAPQGAAVTTQSQSTKFLREDGSWAAPSYSTSYTPSLINGNASTDTSNEAVTASSTNGIYLNLVQNETVVSSHQITGAGGITIGATAAGKITFTGKSGTVTQITTGDGLTTGGGTGVINTSGTISVATGGITNDMLAGSIANGKLVNDWIKIGTVTKHLGETFELSDLGIARAMNFIGITSTALTDGATTSTLVAKTANSLTKTSNFALGDVVLYEDAEFIWTGSAWELLGDETAYALKSTAVTNVAYANQKFTKTINGTTSDIVALSTIKTDLALVKGDVGLGNVTNHAQVTSLQWDSTNKKITYKVSEGSATDVVSFAQGTNVTLTGASGQLTIAAADPTVTQNILGTSVADTYPLLVSAYKTTENTTTASTTNRVAAIYVQPSTGTLTATKFVGDGSGLTNVSATSIEWSNINNKKFAALYVNATSGGAASDAAATSPYIHLYDNDEKKSTIQLVGAGGTSVSSNASKVVTITSTKYKSTGAANAITSLKLKYSDTTDHDDAVGSSSANASTLGTVTNAVLYIKSLYYGTTSVSTGVSVDNT